MDRRTDVVRRGLEQLLVVVNWRDRERERESCPHDPEEWKTKIVDEFRDAGQYKNTRNYTRCHSGIGGRRTRKFVSSNRGFSQVGVFNLYFSFFKPANKLDIRNYFSINTFHEEMLSNTCESQIRLIKYLISFVFTCNTFKKYVFTSIERIRKFNWNPYFQFKKPGTSYAFVTGCVFFQKRILPCQPYRLS